MLGSLYEKAWELDRSTLADPHLYTTLHRLSRPANNSHNAKHSKPPRKMHLKNGDHSIHFGGLSDRPADGFTDGKDGSKPQRHKSEDHISSKQTEHAARPNQGSVALPIDTSLDKVLDTVLTAWTVLIQRYQRDTFHQFTWGLKDVGQDATQCMQTTELKLADQKSVQSLYENVSNVRSRHLSVDSGSTIFLNDGTEVEVCTTTKPDSNMLNQTVDI